MSDVSMAQYMRIRGEIASDTFLFSDDKAELLDLLIPRLRRLVEMY